MRTRVGVDDHLEFVVGHECFAEQKTQCCNCWRWTGRRLNASEPQQGTPALRGARAPVGEADEAAAEVTESTVMMPHVMPKLSQAGATNVTLAGAPALAESTDNASVATVLARGSVSFEQKALSGGEVHIDAEVHSGGEAAAECKDHDWDCITWSEQGKCETEPAHMMKTCYKACSRCTEAPSACADHGWDCISVAQAGGCSDPGTMQQCPKACGACTP